MYVNDEVVFEGHRIGPSDLADIFEEVNGYEHLNYHEITDEQMENWQEALHPGV